jgi:hypothetical protein
MKDRIKKIIEQANEAAKHYDECALLLRDVAAIYTELNTDNAIVVNREAKEKKAKEMTRRFNELAMYNLFMSEL